MFGVRLIPPSSEKLTTVKLGGCDLRVVSLYDRYGQNLGSPWQIKHRIFNVGTESCVVQSEQLDAKGPFTIGPGAIFEREMVAERKIQWQREALPPHLERPPMPALLRMFAAPGLSPSPTQPA